MTSSALRLRLPATSANLGPGFDTLALALGLYLTLEARPASSFFIEARGRNQEICGQLEGNLLLETYRRTVAAYAQDDPVPLALSMDNGIPLGMGCGSSAASRLAGVALAAHFGGLGWARERVLAEAVRMEGHPDNAAACWLGGFVASAMDGDAEPLSTTVDGEEARPLALSIDPPPGWHALLALPAAPLATTASRAVLPEHYSRRDAVLNLQRVALLTAAFAAGRGDLLRAATGDSLHQPYRGAVCPLLPALLPLAGSGGVLSVTLSGAGPAVLLLLEEAAAAADAERRVRRSAGQLVAETLLCSVARGSAEVEEVKMVASFLSK